MSPDMCRAFFFLGNHLSASTISERAHTVVQFPEGLAATSDGLPLGLCAIKFWSRKKFKGTPG